MVHYVSYGSYAKPDEPHVYERGLCRAAVITEVNPDDIDGVKLCVMSPVGLIFTPAFLTHDEGHRTPLTGKAPGTWHWAEPAPKRFPDEEPAAPEATV
jgi:hypothetical protein